MLLVWALGKNLSFKKMLLYDMIYKPFKQNNINGFSRVYSLRQVWQMQSIVLLDNQIKWPSIELAIR